MSRIAKYPVVVPDKVQVTVDKSKIVVKGPLGTLEHPAPREVVVKLEDGKVTFAAADGSKAANALSGTLRANVANMVTGVKDGFERKLEIVGIGYRAQMQGKAIQLALGYSHPVIFPLPDGVTAEIDKQVGITLRGADKALLGETAAKLRALRKPDPYKGKGIKYAGEVIRRKVGKKAGAK